MDSLKLYDKIKKNPKFPRKDAPYKTFFTWNIHYDCNYHCTYCHAPKPNNLQARYVSHEKWISIWENICKMYGECEILISGGEPSTYPGFMDFIIILSQLHIIELCTNFSWEVERFIERVNPKRVRVGTSFHPEFSTIDDFLAKIIKLKENGFEIWVNFVPWPPLLSMMKEYKRKIEDIGSKFVLQPFCGNYQGRKYPEGYTPEEKKYFEILDDKDNKGILDFKSGPTSANGQLCRMGQMYAYILPDGNAWRCCVPEGGSLGNLIDGSFQLLNEAEPCTCSYCHCYRRMIVGGENNWVDKWGRG